ncbi:MAG: DUF4238 domain-containing protein [Muribaculaceae bacterium]|nr:DUF4238 domain-containing protein [bacterium]MCM1494118.1 DUF4238 domain-containing protein [Muribaculaceae bacterium]
MNKEPIRHHYIPQFILRNFCFDDSGDLFYFDKKKSQIFVKKTRDIFAVRNLYRDEINNPEEPTKIEKDMARFEGEVSRIITEKFLCGDEIAISPEEDEKLKIFFAIMSFRSNITSKKFGTGASEENKAFYSIYQEDGNLSDLWKRNLGNLINCRTLKEIWEHKGIDTPIKLFFQRDTVGYFGLYFVVAERRGFMDFVIGDAYPTIVNGVTEWGMQMPLYSIFPISPDRVILLTANGISGAPKSVAFFSDEILRKPQLSRDRKTITIRVRKMYENEIKYINSSLAEEAYEGIAFRNKDRVTIL